MKLKCTCGKEWDYNGKNKFNATCPDCRRLVKIQEDWDELHKKVQADKPQVDWKELKQKVAANNQEVVK